MDLNEREAQQKRHPRNMNKVSTSYLFTKFQFSEYSTQHRRNRGQQSVSMINPSSFIFLQSG